MDHIRTPPSDWEYGKIPSYFVPRCALFFWSLELPNQFGMFEDTFLLKTLFTSFFGDFDPEDRIDNRFQTFISLSTYFFLVIYLICLKAMIAFISETFADIFDDKIAVIARERRLMLSWTSCGMGDAKIELSSISSIIVLVPVLVSTTHHSIITTYHVYDDVYQFLKVKRSEIPPIKTKSNTNPATLAYARVISIVQIF